MATRVEVVRGVDAPTSTIATRLRSLPLRALVREWRSTIALEFAGQFWLRPGGGTYSWPRTRPFGTRDPGPATLQSSGAYRLAWTGSGGGAIERYTETTAEFGVSGAAFPFASTHRGGAGSQIVLSPAQTAITPRMRGYVAARFGVRFGSRKSVLLTPRRPHATVNPLALERISKVAAAHVAGRAAQGQSRSN